jgi:endoglucanase
MPHRLQVFHERAFCHARARERGHFEQLSGRIPSSLRARASAKLAGMNRRFLALVLIALTVFPGLRLLGQPQAVDAFEHNRRLGRGVNIIGYDPLWRARDQARFQERHFQLLKEAGFQSVRINLHAFRHMDKADGWALSPAWFETLDWAVRGATRNGLLAILDLHEFGALGNDAEGHKAQFLAFWKQVAAHYRNAPDAVIFEILNEPNKALTPVLWNQYLREALAIIRESNPTRTVIVGPAFWNSVDHLDELELPDGDRHLIVTVHYYKPMLFTHQGARWTDHKDKSGVTWGTEEERKAVQNDFAKVSSWAGKNKRPIFLGEFGAYDKGPMESRVRYTDFVARTAEASGWSWAYWQFDSDFILYDIQRDTWVEPILSALVPKASAATTGDVKLVFKVTVPETTEGTHKTVCIAGTLDRLQDSLPAWDPSAMKLTRSSTTQWKIDLTGKAGTELEYKYALGDWSFVEKAADCGEIPNRTITLTGGSSGVQEITDTVANWRNVPPCGD